MKEPREPSLSELLKKHPKGFTQVVSEEKWFDDKAKPKKKELPPSEFDETKEE